MGSGSTGLLETAAACAEQQLEAFTPPQLAKVGGQCGGAPRMVASVH